ncbi:MAG: copper chaperone PCu(A)C [Zoogloeaceae bacterium]|jgi:copper(I)-binding protein|nr:copper chaperone PCu(A)C [Zoogloeaceae bacterium]
MRLSLILPAFCLAALPATVQAQVEIHTPWVRATVPQQQATGAFFSLVSPVAAKLVAARSPIAGRVELHTIQIQGEVMSMRPISEIPLPANEVVNLAPGGAHLMLLELKTSLKAGEQAPLILVVEDEKGERKEYPLTAEVRPLDAPSPTLQGQHEHRHEQKN